MLIVIASAFGVGLVVGVVGGYLLMATTDECHRCRPARDDEAFG